jgi:hypothetical protein
MKALGGLGLCCVTRRLKLSYHITQSRSKLYLETRSSFPLVDLVWGSTHEEKVSL